MAKSTNKLNEATILTAALEGLKLQKQKVDEQIQEVTARLNALAGRRPVGRPPKGDQQAPKKGKRVLSAAARKRISQAQKKRWAQHRKEAAKA